MKKFIIFVAALAMVGAFVATAMADVDLYGSARFRTFYTDTSKEASSTDFDDKELEWQIGYLTRFGAKFKSDKITGRFELDARVASSSWDSGFAAGSGASSVGDMRLRLLWGEYDFGSWKFMIGQNYPLYDAAISGINYYSGGLMKFGGIAYDLARTSQMRFTINNLRIALLPTDTSKMDDMGSYSEDVDKVLPKLELRYDMKADWGRLDFIGGYQTYKVVNDVDADKSVSSWVAGIRGKFNFGAAYLNAGLTYRVNGRNYGAWTVVDELAKFDGNDIQDSEAWGGVVALGFKINDSNLIEASYGYVSSENDLPGTNEDKAQAFALLYKYTVAPGFYIVPEFIYQDNKEKTVYNSSTGQNVETDKGDVTIIGVFWRIDFK